MSAPDTEAFAYYEPLTPAMQAAFDAFLAQAIAQGLTERQTVLKTVVNVYMRRPIPNVPPPLGPSNTGVDLSHWNDNDTPIDPHQWEAIKAAGHLFAWVKMTQGLTFVDPHGTVNKMNGLNVGGIWIGTMHFFEWDKDGTAQVEHHSRVVGEVPGTFYELLDFELVPGASPLTNAQKLICEENLRKSLARYPQLFLGRRPIIYTSRHYWLSMLIPSRVTDIVRDYQFLIADLDGPFDLLLPGQRHAHFRQKSHTYTIQGIQGPIDLDEYMGQPPAPKLHSPFPLSHYSNQGVLNLFFNTFGSFDQLARAIPNWVSTMATPTSLRTQPFQGPPIEHMALFYQEMDQLIPRYVPNQG